MRATLFTPTGTPMRRAAGYVGSWRVADEWRTDDAHRGALDLTAGVVVEAVTEAAEAVDDVVRVVGRIAADEALNGDAVWRRVDP